MSIHARAIAALKICRALFERALRKIFLSLLGFFFTISPFLSIASEIEFNQLNACKEINETFSRMESLSSDCVPPIGIIDKVIQDYSNANNSKICFMGKPPAPSLANFRCIYISFKESRSISCYRPASSDLLSEYKLNYNEKYISKESVYIQQARRCPGSNGDASRSISTTFPQILVGVARHDFGFLVQYGTTKPSSAMVSHGFAKTSPEVSSRGPNSIEYVAFVDGLIPYEDHYTEYGNWRLNVDTSTEFYYPVIKALQRQGLDAYVASVSIEIRRTPQAQAYPKANSLPNKLSSIIALRLEDEGFEEMDDEDVQKYTGMTKSEIIKAVIKAFPFGAPILANDRKMDIRVLLKKSGLSCTKNNRGGVGAYLITFDGAQNVQVDFGNITTLVLGLGACGSPNNSSRQYARNLTLESKQAILDELRRR